MVDVPETIRISEGGYTMPVMDILTGRGFITGKSGSGKSNTASVIAEELLGNGFPLLIVDTDGEYYGLKERFDLIHVGASEDSDLKIEDEDAGVIVDLCLLEKVPVILDVSGYHEEEAARALIDEVVSGLFRREHDVRIPFLLLVEEIHEFVPETGAHDDLGKTLVRVAKRGRKRGLGMCGLSQRPAAVDKNFITQCDWMVWHRLTWENDTRVVSQILGSDAGSTVQELDPGEALVMADWDDQVRRIQFRRKRTFDAGATPGLEDLRRSSDDEIDAEVLDRLQTVAGGDVELPSRSGDPTDNEEEAAEVDQDERESDADETGLAIDQGEPESETVELQPTVVDEDSIVELGSNEVEETRVDRHQSQSPRDARFGGRWSTARHTSPGGREGEFDPLWELGQLVLYVFSVVRRVVVASVRHVRNALRPADEARPIDTIGNERWANEELRRSRFDDERRR